MSVKNLNDPKGVFRRRFQTDYPKNYLYHETLHKLVASDRFEFEVWEPLTTAQLIDDSQCPYEAACEVIHAACTPIESFISDSRQCDVDGDIRRFKKRIDTFLAALSAFRSSRRWDLQRKIDHYLEPSRRQGEPQLYINPDALAEFIAEELRSLKWIMSLPSPPPGDIQRKKVNGARVKATHRACLLKREIGNRFKRKHHRTIATIINALESLDPPYTEKDVFAA